VVPPDDADAFLGALRRLLTSSDLRAAEGLRVAAWAREAFAPAKQAAAYLRLFEALRTPLSPAGTAVS
jgi:glycosyltransferase involved in cell wall biosynthesis